MIHKSETTHSNTSSIFQLKINQWETKIFILLLFYIFFSFLLMNEVFLLCFRFEKKYLKKIFEIRIDVLIFKIFDFLALLFLQRLPFGWLQIFPRLITRSAVYYKVRGWLQIKTPEFIWRRQVWFQQPCDYKMKERETLHSVCVDIKNITKYKKRLNRKTMQHRFQFFFMFDFFFIISSWFSFDLILIYFWFVIYFWFRFDLLIYFWFRFDLWFIFDLSSRCTRFIWVIYPSWSTTFNMWLHRILGKNNRTTSKGGGVGLYISETYTYKVRQYITNLDQSIEHQWVEVKGRKNKNSSFLVGCIYQPSSNESENRKWCEIFDSLMTQIIF